MAILEHLAISRAKVNLFKCLTIGCLFILISCQNRETLIVNEQDNQLELHNGILKFQNKSFSGILVRFYNAGDMQSEINYISGMKHGLERQWYENGQLAIERHYSKGYKIGLHKGWWENGLLKFEYTFNDKGAFNGNVKEWYAHGVLSMNFNYENGQEVGSQRLYNPDGRIKSNYEVVNGDRFGLIGLKTCYTVSINSDEVQ